MNRRSFLGSVIAVMAALLLPKRFGGVSPLKLRRQNPTRYFRGVTIPKDAQIQSASVEVFPFADVIVPRSESGFFVVEGIELPKGKGMYVSEMPDIDSVIIEIVDRAGWVAGEVDILMFLENN